MTDPQPLPSPLAEEGPGERGRRPHPWRRLIPDTLLGRIALVVSAGVLLAQLIGNLIWANQIKTRAQHEAREAAQHLAVSAAGAIRFFRDLPPNYRPILIEQLRTMGGTRFFVNVNRARVPVARITDNPLAQTVTDTVTATLQHEPPHVSALSVAFAWPDGLKVSDEGATVQDLPDSWVEPTLLVKPRPAPVLVIQAEFEPGSWLYLATLMPDPYFLDNANPLTLDRIALQGVTLVTVLLLAIALVRTLTRPLERIAQSASAFGSGISPDPLPETGTREVRRTARAFNDMQARIQRYLDDRERLFASISHDLRTPITRLKLRTELLDDEATQADFHEDLDELDMMVKGALQSVKDTDIHENRTAVRLDTLLETLVRHARLAGHAVELDAPPVSVTAKPLALKRALSNLLDNALHYGERAEITVAEDRASVTVTIRDHGPGVPEASMDTLFQPYVRLEHGQKQNRGGMGLGLGIARNIVHAHGGELTLSNHPAGGLVAVVRLPKG